jgi:hypothetical protein
MGNSVRAGRRVARCVVLVAGLLGILSSSVSAQINADGRDARIRDAVAGNAAQNQPLAWDVLRAMPANVMAGEPWIRPERYGSFKLNADALRAQLAKAPMEFSPEAANPIVIEIPLPDGSLGLFECVESPIMAPELQAKFPDIRTYLVWSAQDRSINGRIDLTPRGFHAMIFTPESGTIFVDPVTRDDFVHHASYFRDDLRTTKQWQCEFDPKEHDLREEIPAEFQGIAGGTEATGNQLRTYRLALACTGEYAAFHGGFVAAVAAAMATTVNRVVGVYEKEVAIRMVLVANNNNLIYLNSATDPYTNGDGFTMLDQNQTNITSVIGSANYDIGHVVSTGGGGVAGLGVVCSSTNKSRGVTGSPSPVGDPFNIDYVAHEMGHQFGGRHTFNSSTGNCSGNRNASTAYEPGSGTTIMAYAGICVTDDVQSNSDAYFHSASYGEIITFVSTGGGRACDALTNTGNNPPSVDAGPAYTIPINTQFVLTATGSDPDGDTVSFNWEQRNLGPTLSISASDNGSSPIFRSYTGTTSGQRTFPRTTTVGGTTTVAGDRFPITNRTMSFRATARDNRAGGGGVAFDNTTVTSTTAAGPFTVTGPNTAVSVPGGTAQIITWNVANTNIAPVNTANVNIRFSTDGGTTYPTLLASNVANVGSATLIIPNPVSTVSTNRIRVEAAGNIYFDISDVNFTVTSSPAPAEPTSVIAQPSTICAGSATLLSGNVFLGTFIVWFSGPSGETFVGSGSPIAVSPASTTTYYARAFNPSTGFYSNLSLPVTVTVNPLAVAPTSASVNRPFVCVSDPGTITLSATGGSGTALKWYANSCGGTSIGADNNLVINSPTVTTTYYARWAGSCGDSNCVSVTVVVDAITTPPTSASVNRSGFCAGDPGTITLTATGGSGTTLKWYASSCGGTSIGADNNLVINSPTVPTTYYARWTGSCGDSDCASVSVDVNTADINLDGSIDFGDFLAFFNCYDIEDTCADLDENPGIDFGDFLTFFNGYDSGC